jgi:hypothetical protein
MKKIIFISLLCLTIHLIPSEGHNISLILPVNVQEHLKDSASRVHLIVKIPANFKMACTMHPALGVNFFPKTDHNVSLTNWSEVISTNRFINTKVPATDWVNDIKNELHSEIIEEQEQHHTNFLKHWTLIRYITQGRPQFLGMMYASGPLDCSGVQYTIKVSERMPETEAIQKIKEFFACNVQAATF